MSGRCVDCGYLAFRAQIYAGLRFRGHAGYHEVERPIRDDPLAAENFIPGEANAVQWGEFACFRAAANLPQEIAIRASSPGLDPHDAAREVLYRARGCSSWTQYVPGLDPQLHYQELNAKALEEDRRSFYKQMSELEGQQANQFQGQNKRLGWLAFWVALAIGSIQIITAVAGVTPDALGYRAWRYFIPATCSPISKP